MDRAEVVIRRAGIFALLMVGVFAVDAGAGDSRGEKLKKALGYLQDVSGIEWIEVEGNTAYLGWKARPGDFGEINRAAAVNGNRALGRGVHVWSVEAKDRGWRPGDGPYICETTARGGKVTDSSC